MVGPDNVKRKGADMDGIEIIIPSYKRAGMVEGYDYFPTAVIVVPESQRDEYANHYDSKRIVTLPDSEDGNIARKRNWIIKTFSRPLLMVDDDVQGLGHTEAGRQNIKLSSQEAAAVIEEGTNLADQFKCPIWGINENSDGRNYQEYRPFSLTNPILGPFQCHLEHELKFDERMNTKDDYDMAIQALNRYRKILRLNKYHYICRHGTNVGGIVSYRTRQLEEESCKAIMRKWGPSIISYKLGTKAEKMGDLLNGRVRVPIAGV